MHQFYQHCADITAITKYLENIKIEETLNTYTYLFNSVLNEVVDLINSLE